MEIYVPVEIWSWKLEPPCIMYDRALDICEGTSHVHLDTAYPRKGWN